MFTRLTTIGVGICAAVVCAPAQAQPENVSPREESRHPAVLLALPEISTHDLALHLRAAALRTMPADLLLETSNNWGHQAQITSIQGVRLIQVMRNHGDWEKARVAARELPKKLQCRAGEVYSLTDDRVTFSVRVTMPARVELEKETWQNGIRVYSSFVRARFRLSAHLTMEASLVPGAKAEPSAESVAGMHIVRASYSCSDFVVENVNGLGGDFARWTGGAMERTFKPWQPVVLAEFQKLITRSTQTACENGATRVVVSKFLLQAGAARNTFLLEQDATSERAPSTARSIVIMAPPVQAVPVPILFSSFAIEIPIWAHPDRLPPPRTAPARETHYDHPGLEAHSIHYERPTHSRHSSSSHSQPGPVRKK